MTDIVDILKNSIYYNNCEKQLKFITENLNCCAEKNQIDLFIKIANNIKKKNPVLFELGSGGVDASFYSIIFEKIFCNECTILNTEPRKHLLDEVKNVYKDVHLKNAILIWGANGNLHNINDKNNFLDTPLLSIKNLMNIHNIKYIDIIHMDIQGAELDVCEELYKNDLFNKIHYLFINTHSLSIHNSCLDILNMQNCKYHFSDAYSGGYCDGLIIAEIIH